jgi:hypothetical protein
MFRQTYSMKIWRRFNLQLRIITKVAATTATAVGIISITPPLTHLNPKNSALIKK